MKVNQDLEMSDTLPFKIIFCINETENFTKFEGQDSTNTKVCTFEH